MMKAKLLLLAFISFGLGQPMFGETYKSAYTIPCGDLWPAVKSTLGHAENYTVVGSDDAKMTASYKVKHDVHVTVTGALLQRTNRVTLVSKGTGCEMQVVSNYSGFEHNDRGDFKDRVDAALAKPKSEPVSEAAKSSDPAK